MYHDHDICTHIKCDAVAGFLVAAIAGIDLVNNRNNPKFLSQNSGIVPAAVIHQYHFVNLGGDFPPGVLQRFFCIIRRKNNNYFFTVYHTTAP